MISVAEHTARPDGSVRLVLRVEGVSDPDEQLADVGGTVTVVGDDALVAWTWSAAMLPLHHVETCTAHVERAVIAWAARWSNSSIDLTL